STIVTLLFYLLGCTSNVVSLSPGSPITVDPTPNIDRFIAAQGGGSIHINSLNANAKASAEGAIQQDFSEMMNFCKGVLSGFEPRSNTYKQVALWLSIIGAIAGSIVVPALSATAPAANAAWTAAFGGLSGVTNTAQHTMTAEGLSGTTILTDRN